MTREGIKMTNDEAKSVLFNMLGKGIYVKDTKENQAILTALRALEQEPCEMTVEEYRQRMILAFHNADTDELIAVCVQPTEKEFEHLERLLKNHYKQEPCEDLCKSCDTKGCIFQSGIKREKCDFYTREKEPHVDWYDIPSDEMTLGQARQAVKDLRKMWAEHLWQEPCEDAISRQAALDAFGLSEKSRKYGGDHSGYDTIMLYEVQDALEALPPVTPQPKTGHCKDCKYFEYDSLAKVNGIKLIFAHEICSKWGRGCKTREDGYCFLFEPRESEDK